MAAPSQPVPGSSTSPLHNDVSEPFPSLSDPPSPKTPTRASTDKAIQRSRNESTSSSITSRLRSASKTFAESSPPTGAWVATGNIASSVPSISDIRRGSYSSDGWTGEGQVREKERRASLVRQGSSQSDITRRKSSGVPASPGGKSSALIREESVPEVAEPEHLKPIPSGVPVGVSMSEDSRLEPVGSQMSSPSNATEMKHIKQKTGSDQRSSSDTNLTPGSTSIKADGVCRTEPFDNGYQFPPKHDWKESTTIALLAFWKFFITPIGFVVTIYCLNVVAWGGMLFLLLCNASPAMCTPTCNDINSPRRIWIEIDSQILNALFCVTGFGTIPWRFRDLYYLMQYRIQKKEMGLRRLAGINRGWFRLAGSQDLPAEIGPVELEAGTGAFPEHILAFPLKKQPDAPLTGIRAPPTAVWKLDFVIWSMVWNTFLQAVLSGFMWGMNRYDRPSWSTGLFVALACIVAACGGIMSFIEGKHVKTIEGVPVSAKDQEQLARDREAGIIHYNNINDEKPKEKKADEEKGLFHRKTKHSTDVNVEESAIKDGVAQVVR